jgi:hypothetical protein
MRVFVSSTVYDLVDARAELEQLLAELGVSPVMSDDKLSDFNLPCDANSIETCLLNVESSDAVIVVLDQRYGPALGSYGFDDVSATHLEYRHAKFHAKPIYFYVRDRLEADYNIRQKNKDADDVKFSWVSPKEHGLFEFLKEHRALIADSHENNWFSIFTNVVDLKASIRQHFEPVVKPQVLVHLKELTSLQTLRLGTEVTTAGVAVLQSALPNCRIYQSEAVAPIKKSGRTDNFAEPTKESREAAIAAIRELGGIVTFDEKNPSRPLVGVNLHFKRVPDAGLVHLKGLTSLTYLSINDQVTDAGLEHLKGLTGLQKLVLSGTDVTDAGLEHLNGLTSLQTLLLGSKVTDAGLEHLKGLTSLQKLSLMGTQVTDAGLVHLKGLTSLKMLSLQKTKVTTAGVKDLQQFPAHGTAWTQTRRRGNLGKPTENEVESLSHRFCDIRSPAVGRRRCLRRPSRRNPIFTAYLRRPGIAEGPSIRITKVLYRQVDRSCVVLKSGRDSLAHDWQVISQRQLIRSA